MLKFSDNLSRYPARISLFWYLGLIIVGVILLQLPFCRASGVADSISLLDAVFTTVSASCVTGLAVRSTAHDFSFWGQLVILVLIQLGGIGIMSVTTFVSLNLGKKASLRERALLRDTLGAQGESDLVGILRHVFWFTFFFESVGFALLAVRNLFNMAPGPALWHALFHSVSAFCNAGFALYDTSLEPYQVDYVVNLVIMVLIISGGIGYPVMIDLRRRWIPWRGFDWDQLHVHSKIMLLGTAVLLAVGTLAILTLEWDGALAKFSLPQKALVALFHSVSSRTAGFNSIELRTLNSATILIVIMLMMVGAGPCSTAGGFKVSTLMMLLLRARASFLGQKSASIFRRTIPEEAFHRAIASLMMFAIVGALAICSLLLVEQVYLEQNHSHERFLSEVFEVFSALGTVGLSLGLTSELTTAGKLVIVVLMFLGRLGPITVFAAVSMVTERRPIEYPNEEPLIG